jgi:cytoskeletal protein CcmA (bactofilin family)
MDNKEKYSLNEGKNIRISGMGSAGGGVYNQVIISGSGVINGDIECNTFSSSGTSQILGNVKSKYIKTSGTSKIDGSIRCEEMKISGSTVVNGNLQVNTMDISGSGKINEDLSCEEVSISGFTKIDGNCDAEKFKSSGKFQIDGLLNAGEIKISMCGKCSVKEIGGEKIEITLGKNYLGVVGNLINTLINNKAQMVTEIIEGDDIYIENTIAEVVRGNSIKIGPKCEIQKVEYINEISVDNSSKIGERIKI